MLKQQKNMLLLNVKSATYSHNGIETAMEKIWKNLQLKLLKTNGKLKMEKLLTWCILGMLIRITVLKYIQIFLKILFKLLINIIRINHFLSQDKKYHKMLKTTTHSTNAHKRRNSSKNKENLKRFIQRWKCFIKELYRRSIVIVLIWI